MASQGGRHDLHGDWTERERRAAVVRSHVEVHGYWCPGYQVAGHASRDLCADHVVSVGVGGHPSGPLGVLCRRCNSRKGNGMRVRIDVPSVRSQDWLS